ncbi:hypothetical protein EDD22DRAFT_141433 [Suillus occidentalis]|nr:hypothetical protein EDD22DRAFT_141433 [Suillus occidentalis]
MMRRWQLPLTKKDTITCYDDLGTPKTHGLEQRYVSPTTGVCRKLVVQAVSPSGKSEVPISNHTNQASKIAIWLLANSPIRGWILFKWVAVFLWFTLKLLWSVIWLLAQLFAPIDLADDAGEDTDLYNTGYYKPFARWIPGSAMGSSFEHGAFFARSRGGRDGHTNKYPLSPYSRHPRPHSKRVGLIVQIAETIIRTKFIAISYRALGRLHSRPKPRNSKKRSSQKKFAQLCSD